MIRRARDLDLVTRDARLSGALRVPRRPLGLAILAHAGGSHLDPGDGPVGDALRDAGIATLTVDLLDDEELRVDRLTAALRFDVPRLAERLVAVIDQAGALDATSDLPLGLLASDTAAAAALVAAAERPGRVRAVVSRAGRPDLAGTWTDRVATPTLLIVAGRDAIVAELNRRAAAALGDEARLEVVPGATHAFSEPGALDRVAALAREWLAERLAAEPVGAGADAAGRS